MMSADWDAYRFVLAVAEAGSLADAARKLRVDATTVGRRVAALERRLGARLFERRERRLAATPLGSAVAAGAAEAGEILAAVRARAAGADAKAVGAVRLTSLLFLINHVLAERVPALLRDYPELRIELAASSSNANLSRREADVALRFARPRAGGDIVCRRLAAIGYAAYGPRGDNAKALPWIGYDDSLADLPEAAWIVRRAAGGERVAATANETDTMRRLAAAGAGRVVIPIFIGDADPALARCSARLAEREVWLLVHRAVRGLARVTAVVDWAADSVRRTLA